MSGDRKGRHKHMGSISQATRTGGAVGKPWVWAFRWMKPNVIAHSMLCLPNQSEPTLVET